jgi:hypothetical protein
MGADQGRNRYGESGGLRDKNCSGRHVPSRGPILLVQARKHSCCSLNAPNPEEYQPTAINATSRGNQLQLCRERLKFPTCAYIGSNTTIPTVISCRKCHLDDLQLLVSVGPADDCKTSPSWMAGGRCNPRDVQIVIQAGSAPSANPSGRLKRNATTYRLVIQRSAGITRKDPEINNQVCRG